MRGNDLILQVVALLNEAPGSVSNLMKLFLLSVASGLTDIEQHEVKLQQKKHKVRVTPFINGKITDFKVRYRKRTC